jgi:hypothetical protein
MAAFARGNTPHGQAIKSVREENWFSEELYARFRLLGVQGTWDGKPMQDRLPTTAAVAAKVSDKAAALSAARASIGANLRANARTNY